VARDQAVYGGIDLPQLVYIDEESAPGPLTDPLLLDLDRAQHRLVPIPGCMVIRRLQRLDGERCSGTHQDPCRAHRGIKDIERAD